MVEVESSDSSKYPSNWGEVSSELPEFRVQWLLKASHINI